MLGEIADEFGSEKPPPLIVVSNRLPISVVRQPDSALAVEAATGGLVTAMRPVLKRHGGKWVGWNGLTGPLTARDRRTLARAPVDVEMSHVSLNKKDIDGFYHGASNATLWPLFHDFLDQATFLPDSWRTYLKVNKTFAKAALEAAEGDHLLWVHDYHLIPVGREIRKQNCDLPIIFFLHIPFPAMDIFSRLPWRRQILEALLAYDLVGVQTRRDRRNLLGCIRSLLPEARFQSTPTMTRVNFRGHLTHIGAFPISIDWEEFDGQARGKDVADGSWLLHEHYPDRKILLGVDRMDYSKGISQRLEAFEIFLEKYPEFHEKVVLVQIAVPTRSDVPAYREFQRSLDEMVGNINGRFSRPGWVPIHYKRTPLPRAELLAYYRAAEVAIVASLRDGMNLVVKEYIAASVDGVGSVVLSEFAGAAEELEPCGAFIVNPYDTEGMAEAIRDALLLPDDVMSETLEKLRRQVRENDVHQWARQILQASLSHAVWTA